MNLYVTYEMIYHRQKTLDKLKMKLDTNNVILIKANKGNAIAVTYKSDYDSKVLAYLNHNGYHTTTTKQFLTDTEIIDQTSQNASWNASMPCIRRKIVSQSSTSPTKAAC
jgi:hypothetical protein